MQAYFQKNAACLSDNVVTLDSNMYKINVKLDTCYRTGIFLNVWFLRRKKSKWNPCFDFLKVYSLDLAALLQNISITKTCNGQIRNCES